MSGKTFASIIRILLLILILVGVFAGGGAAISALEPTMRADVLGGLKLLGTIAAIVGLFAMLTFPFWSSRWIDW